MGESLENFLTKISPETETTAHHEEAAPSSHGLLAMLRRSIGEGGSTDDGSGSGTGIPIRHSATPPSEHWYGVARTDATSPSGDGDEILQEDAKQDEKNENNKVAVEIIDGSVDLDQLTSFPLEVSPIARYGSEHYPGQRGRRIVASNKLIAYALKNGQIRILDIATGAKLLLKSHKHQVVDLCFFSDEDDRLASVDIGGTIALWDLDLYPGEDMTNVINGTLLAELKVEVDKDNVFPCLAWHPSQRTTLCVAVSSVVVMVNISALQAEMTEESSSIVIGKEDTSESLKLMGLTKEDLGVNINSISFSPDGNLLAAATQDGNVNIINASEYEQALVPTTVITVHIGATGGASMVSFIRDDLLFTAGDENSELKLWALNQNDEAAYCDPEEQDCLQLISRNNSNFAAVVVAEAQTVVLGDTSEGRMFCVRVSGNKFHCIAAFSLKLAIASFSGIFDRNNNIVNMSCDQQYSIPLAVCEVKHNVEIVTSVENKEQEEELEPPQKDGSQVDAENVTEVNDTTAISVEMPVDQQGDGNATADVNDTQTRTTQLLTPQSLISPPVAAAASVAAAPNLESENSNSFSDSNLQQVVKNLQHQINLDQKKRLEQEFALTEKMQSLPKEIGDTVRQQVEKATKALSPKSLKPEKPIQPGSIDESVKKGIHAALPDLEKVLAGKLPAALSNTLKESIKEVIVPAFEAACKEMFNQMNTTFENGLKEYIQEVQRVSQGAISNEETAKSLLRSVESLKTVQDKMQTQLASAVQTLEGFASKMPAPERESISLEKIEEQLDPTVEIRDMLTSENYELAFNKALSLGDLSIVGWICKEVPYEKIFNSASPTPILSQGVILSLIQQLSQDLNSDSFLKLAWIREAVMSLDPAHPLCQNHARTILEQVYSQLTR